MNIQDIMDIYQTCIWCISRFKVMHVCGFRFNTENNMGSDLILKIIKGCTGRKEILYLMMH